MELHNITTDEDVPQFVLDFAQHHPKLIVHKLDVWDCGCTCCLRMRPMYHDMAYKQVVEIIHSTNKRYNKLNDQYQILEFENWSLSELKIKHEQEIDELERLLHKKRSREDVFSEPLPKT